MKKIFLVSAALLGAIAVQAQDIYKVEALTSEDLNGTARFVGMGGAMNALGADLSTMGTNPAGIALYRRNDAAISGSLTTQPGAKSFLDIDKTRASFDQAGVVFKTKVGGSCLKYVNFGFNYQKRKNFKGFVGVDGGLTGGVSQTQQMAEIANGFDLDTRRDYENLPLFVGVGYDGGAIVKNGTDANGNQLYEGFGADSYDYKRVKWGGVEQYDFNMSFNLSNQVYLGVTMGLYNVTMHSAVDHYEYQNAYTNTSYLMQNEELLEGNGFDVKAGIIVRPVKESPFRLGFAVSTPIWYDLTYQSNVYVSSPADGSGLNFTEASDGVMPYDYKVRTPWKFNVSAATTIGKLLALDAEYEFSDYSSASVSYPDYDDYYGYYSTSGQKDYNLKREIDNHLKAVSTVRVGAELQFLPGAFARVGYNYVSAPMSSRAYPNLYMNGPAPIYQSGSDYVNLGATNRLTAGLGYHGRHFYVDAAYQYQHQKATAYAFQTYNEELGGMKVCQKRNNFMLTLGVKF